MPADAAKKTIAVDIDDVLTPHAAELIRFSNQRWGTKLSIEDYDEHWARMWRVDLAELERRVPQIFHLAKDYQPYEDSDKVLDKLSKNHHLVILTSRRREMVKDTEDWLAQHYKDIFSEIYHSGIWDDPSNKDRHNETKAQILAKIGADYLIDDQPKHCIAAAQTGVKALLFGDYPWNREVSAKPNIVKVSNWKAVGEYFDL